MRPWILTKARRMSRRSRRIGARRRRHLGGIARTARVIRRIVQAAGVGWTTRYATDSRGARARSAGIGRACRGARSSRRAARGTSGRSATGASATLRVGSQRAHQRDHHDQFMRAQILHRRDPRWCLPSRQCRALSPCSSGAERIVPAVRQVPVTMRMEDVRFLAWSTTRHRNERRRSELISRSSFRCWCAGID